MNVCFLFYVTLLLVSLGEGVRIQLQNPIVEGEELTVICISDSGGGGLITLVINGQKSGITGVVNGSEIRFNLGTVSRSKSNDVYRCDDLLDNTNAESSPLMVLYYPSVVDIEGQNVVFDPSPENSTVVEGGTARFNCVPKVNGVPGLAVWIVQPNGSSGVTPRTDNTTNLTGASGVYLSPDRTQLIITGVQNSLHLTRVECRGTNADATFSLVPADTVYIIVQSALTPDGLVSLYNGSQLTFTCSVTVAAAWTISGLSGISVISASGLLAANNNPRITTTDTSGVTQSSTITISDFSAADNRGTIQCINLDDGSVQGTATISIVPEDLTTLSPTLIRKIILPSQLAVVLVWSVPASVADDVDGFVISVVMVTPSGPKAIQQTTAGKQVKAYGVYLPEKGASYQVTVHMTMNGSHSRPLTVEVNL